MKKASETSTSNVRLPRRLVSLLTELMAAAFILNRCERASVCARRWDTLSDSHHDTGRSGRRRVASSHLPPRNWKSKTVYRQSWARILGQQFETILRVLTYPYLYPWPWSSPLAWKTTDRLLHLWPVENESNANLEYHFGISTLNQAETKSCFQGTWIRSIMDQKARRQGLRALVGMFRIRPSNWYSEPKIVDGGSRRTLH